MTGPFHIAVLADFEEEDWPSMELCDEMLMAGSVPSCTFSRVRPPFRRLFSKIPFFGRNRSAFNADRLKNRFLHYPRFIRRHVSEFNAFHIVDHSYAQLVHSLPAERTGVYCHDLDAFRTLLEPDVEPRPWWFKRLAEQQLSGLRKAAIVFHSSLQTRDGLLDKLHIDHRRLVHAPYGVSSEFTAEANTSCPDWLNQLDSSPWVVHVGSCIPRKRIDVLLDVVASTRIHEPSLRLVKIGGNWTEEQNRQIAGLGLASSIIHRHGLPRDELAHVYRRAAAVLVTSDSEGFGLPVVEALACGATVLASDIAVLRETGGEAAQYAPRADLQAWSDRLLRIVRERAGVVDRQQRLQWAARFTWKQHAATIREAYQKLVND